MTAIDTETKTSLVTLFEQGAPLPKLMDRAEASIASAIRGPIEAPALIRGALLQVSMDAALQKCDKLSIVQAVMQAAALGLMVGGPAGEAAMIPYKSKAKLLPMVRGFVTLAKRADRRLTVTPRLVYPDDKWDVVYGTRDEIIHKPKLDSEHRKDSDIIHVYAIFKIDGTTVDFEWMTREEVEAVRAVSKSKDDGPWVTWYGEQAKKTVLKRGLKRFPLSPEVSAAIELDNRFETGTINEPSTILDSAEEVQAHVVERTRERTEALREKMAT